MAWTDSEPFDVGVGEPYAIAMSNPVGRMDGGSTFDIPPVIAVQVCGFRFRALHCSLNVFSRLRRCSMYRWNRGLVVSRKVSIRYGRSVHLLPGPSLDSTLVFHVWLAVFGGFERRLDLRAIANTLSICAFRERCKKTTFHRPFVAFREMHGFHQRRIPGGSKKGARQLSCRASPSHRWATQCPRSQYATRPCPRLFLRTRVATLSKRIAGVS